MLGAPNVRQAASPGELAALLRRYADGVQSAIARGAEIPLKLLEQQAEASFAVINLKQPFLREFVTEGKTLFANYHAGVASSVRRAADVADDQARTGVDAILFRSFCQQDAVCGADVRRFGVDLLWPLYSSVERRRSCGTLFDFGGEFLRLYSFATTWDRSIMYQRVFEVHGRRGACSS